MTPHTHREYVDGCYRCEIGRDEVEVEVERMADSFDHAIRVQAEALARLDAEDADAEATP